MCRNSTSERTTNKNNRNLALLAIMLAPLLAGCGDSDRSKIVGIWEIESADKVLRRIKDKDSQAKKPGTSRMRLEFHSRGTLTTSTRMGSVQGRKEGQWEWLSYDDDSSTAQ